MYIDDFIKEHRIALFKFRQSWLRNNKDNPAEHPTNLDPDEWVAEFRIWLENNS